MKHLLLRTAMLASLAAPAWGSTVAHKAGEITACVPNAQSQALAQPYDGYQPTGYKGALERDRAWFAAVRKTRHHDGTSRYVFRHARAGRRVEFESIETVSLGGSAVGFAAYRQGCGELFDARGQQLDVPAFEELESDGWDLPPQSARLKRKVSGPEESSGAFSYLLFVNGQLMAASPHQYLARYSQAKISSANTQIAATGRAIVAVTPSAGIGLLDLRTLREVLAPSWEGVDQISDFTLGNDRSAASYLLALDQDGLHLHTLDGRPIALPRFDSISFIHGWYAQDNARLSPDSDPLVIQTQELSRDAHGKNADGPCRLYNQALQPLLESALPAGACLRKSVRSARHFAYSTDGRTQIYRKQLTGDRLLTLERIATDVDGALVYALDGGTLLLQTTRQPPYRLVTPEGQDVPERSFDAFHNMGCGFVSVRRGDKRWMLQQDGSLSSQLLYPFSC